MIVALLGGSFCDGIEWIDDVLEKNRPVGFEETTNVLRQSIDGLVDDQLVRVASPSRGLLREKHKSRYRTQAKRLTRISNFSGESQPHFRFLYLALAARSVLCFRP